MQKINRYWNSDPDSLVERKRPQTYDLCKCCELVNQLEYREKRLNEAIEELKAENVELKQKLEDAKATAYAESVDAGMSERLLKRALWFARALRARDIQRWWISATCAPITERACSIWNNVERKCLAKAEEYK